MIGWTVLRHGIVDLDANSVHDMYWKFHGVCLFASSLVDLGFCCEKALGKILNCDRQQVSAFKITFTLAFRPSADLSLDIRVPRLVIRWS